MKKSILNLEGVQILSKTQQKNTFGGLTDGGGVVLVRELKPVDLL